MIAVAVVLVGLVFWLAVASVVYLVASTLSPVLVLAAVFLLVASACFAYARTLESTEGASE